MNALQLSSNGPDVTRWQNFLNSHGYPCKVDGYFGPGTKLATIRFQSDNGLKADGSVGTVTLAKAGLGDNVPAAPEKPQDAPVAAPGGALDARSESTLAGMNPNAVPFFRELAHAINEAIAPHVWKWTSGYRSPEEQQVLWSAYKRGGPRAAPPWGSFHQTGLAADGTVFSADDHTPIYDGPDYDKAVKVIQASALRMHSGHSYGDDPHVMKFPPSLERPDMTENGVLHEVRRRIEGGVPIWP